MPRIPDELRRTAVAQDGLVTRRQALDAGLTRHQIDWLVGRGARWRVVLRGVYSVTSGRLTRRQEMRAALLYVGDDAVLSGVTVLELYGLKFAPTDRRVHVLVPIARRVRAHAAVVIERTRHMPESVTREGLATAPLTRASVDAARDASTRDAQALLAEVVQRRLTTVARLSAELDASPKRRAADVRAALAAIAGGAASAPEVDLMQICERSALLPAPRMNHPITVDGRRVVADACWPEVRLIVEVDSAEHHGFALDAEHTTRRRTALTAAGWTVLSISPARLRDDPDGVLRDIEAAYLTAGLRAGA